ncbi:hypothetical protein CEY12_15960 [Chryseobacterium sp. T16E-39]|uniref:tetratricopeptide repeat protein n=1 Tax=Chryseobacterium sp. T16E-39 TaxID=2015076 RepID=UPI000B5B3BE6|nr:hypothetical protein [Chryseobacterium sp. T16E-39]ASK31514.1 hypothetical protein CEY12_15960 [Chryseobacterium sp. T16E-39]
MKKILLIFCFFAIGFWASSQTFTEKALQQSVLQLNTAKTATEYDALFKKFSTAKTEEKRLAFYYAAVSQYLKSDIALKTPGGQPVAGSNALAGKFAVGALNAQTNNAELDILLGLIYLQRIALNASSDTQKDLKTASEYISKAEASSPGNPRLNILKAEMAKRQGDKVGAEKLYQRALVDFDAYTSSNSQAPGWGKQILQAK